MENGTLFTHRCPRIVHRLFQFDCKYISNIVDVGFNRRLDVKCSNHTTSKCTQSSIGSSCALQPEWLENFTENPVDEGVSAPRDRPAITSREADSEPPRKVVSGKHRMFTRFPKDQRTRIARTPCRRRTGNAVPRAAIFGELIRANQKVLSEGGDSRNHHRYAAVVQDLATHWIQSYPWKNKNVSGNGKELAKVLGANNEETKVIYIDNSLEL